MMIIITLKQTYNVQNPPSAHGTFQTQGDEAKLKVRKNMLDKTS